MYTLVNQLYTRIFGYPEFNIAILGLQQTGKSQILKALKDHDSPYMVGLKQDYKPTIGLNTTQVKSNKMNFLVWDLGGKQSIRKIWENYFPFCHGVVFLFDSRIAEGLECLRTILGHQQMVRIPILIFVRCSENYVIIQDELNKLKGSEEMGNRAIIVQLLPHSRGRLNEHLQSLYYEIRKIDISIRK